MEERLGVQLGLIDFDFRLPISDFFTRDSFSRSRDGASSWKESEGIAEKMKKPSNPSIRIRKASGFPRTLSVEE
jgi:hypothetical protein